ncbi:hypothetical protein CPC08DRAFT_768616 [Agrocybe pediades]|nr:hypothetical protein CPC08DRAFT_768616 [Agrocybe pediades]
MRTRNERTPSPSQKKATTAKRALPRCRRCADTPLLSDCQVHGPSARSKKAHKNADQTKETGPQGPSTDSSHSETSSTAVNSNSAPLTESSATGAAATVAAAPVSMNQVLQPYPPPGTAPPVPSNGSAPFPWYANPFYNHYTTAGNTMLPTTHFWPFPGQFNGVLPVTPARPSAQPRNTPTGPPPLSPVTAPRRLLDEGDNAANNPPFSPSSSLPSSSPGPQSSSPFQSSSSVTTSPSTQPSDGLDSPEENDAGHNNEAESERSSETEVARVKALRPLVADQTTANRRYSREMNSILSRCERISEETGAWLVIGAQLPNGDSAPLTYSSSRIRSDALEETQTLLRDFNKLVRTLKSSKNKDARSIILEFEALKAKVDQESREAQEKLDNARKEMMEKDAENVRLQRLVLSMTRGLISVNAGEAGTSS